MIKTGKSNQRGRKMKQLLLKIFNEKFIELARSVYKLNDNRSKLKSKINHLTGSSIKEIKQYSKY